MIECKKTNKKTLKVSWQCVTCLIMAKQAAHASPSPGFCDLHAWRGNRESDPQRQQLHVVGRSAASKNIGTEWKGGHAHSDISTPDVRHQMAQPFIWPPAHLPRLVLLPGVPIPNMQHLYFSKGVADRALPRQTERSSMHQCCRQLCLLRWSTLLSSQKLMQDSRWPLT